MSATLCVKVSAVHEKRAHLTTTYRWKYFYGVNVFKQAQHSTIHELLKNVVHTLEERKTFLQHLQKTNRLYKSPTLMEKCTGGRHSWMPRSAEISAIVRTFYLLFERHTRNSFWSRLMQLPVPTTTQKRPMIMEWRRAVIMIRETVKTIRAPATST